MWIRLFLTVVLSIVMGVPAFCGCVTNTDIPMFKTIESHSDWYHFINNQKRPKEEVTKEMILLLSEGKLTWVSKDTPVTITRYLGNDGVIVDVDGVTLYSYGKFISCGEGKEQPVADKEKVNKEEDARKIVQKVSYIARKYNEDHSYSIADRFVCIDMAIDVWNQLKTAGIHAVFRMGNLDFDFPERFFMDDLRRINHIWLLVFIADGKWVPLETTSGQLITPDHPSFKRYWQGPWLKTPAQVKDFEKERNRVCESCEIAEQAIKDFNKYCAGRRPSRDCFQLEGVCDIKDAECKRAVKKLQDITAMRN